MLREQAFPVLLCPPHGLAGDQTKAFRGGSQAINCLINAAVVIQYELDLSHGAHSFNNVLSF